MAVSRVELGMVENTKPSRVAPKGPFLRASLSKCCCLHHPTHGLNRSAAERAAMLLCRIRAGDRWSACHCAVETRHVLCGSCREKAPEVTQQCLEIETYESWRMTRPKEQATNAEMQGHEQWRCCWETRHECLRNVRHIVQVENALRANHTSMEQSGRVALSALPAVYLGPGCPYPGKCVASTLRTSVWPRGRQPATPGGEPATNMVTTLVNNKLLVHARGHSLRSDFCCVK